MNPPAGPGVLAPFRTRNYRRQWIGDLATSWAFEMEVLILGWYVLVATESVFWLSIFGALHYLGTLFAPGFGVVGDRIGLRNLLCLMRATYAILSGTMALLLATDQATLPLIFGIAALLGVVRPSDIGVRSGLVASIVPAGQLNGALALSRTTFDTARVFGALAGTGLFAAFGIAAAYGLVTACYVLGLLLTLSINAPAQASKKELRSPFRDLLDGLNYIWRTPHVQAVMWLAFLANFSAFPISLGLMPYIAKNVYGLDQTGLGLLVASFAAGAFLGSVVLATTRNAIMPGRLMIKASVFWHLSLLIFAFTTNRWAGMGLLLTAGFMQSLSMLPLMFILLRTTEPEIRGRIMGVRMLAIYSLPIGLMLAGILIPRIGYVATAGGYAALGIVLTAAIGFRWRRSIWASNAAANG